MWHSLMLKLWRPDSTRTRPQATQRRAVRLGVEQLEDRLVPSNFTAATVSDLIADINAANLAGGSNTITLTAPATSPYVLTAVDNTTHGANGLPVIAKNDTLTIIGNGDTIERSTASGTPNFRLFDVAKGGSLILENLTLQNGLAFGAGSSAEGGAIYNQGTLDLNGVTVQNNIAQGQQGASGVRGTATVGQSAAGGGIYSSGSLTLEGGTSVQDNQALGGRGGTVFPGVLIGGGGKPSPGGGKPSGPSGPGAGPYGLAGGNGFGGGVYVAGGTATMIDASVSANTARGGSFGAGIVHSGSGGAGEGGGLYIDPAATVSLNAFTVANVLNNTASTSDPNIHGSYEMIS